jgi:hypothetical protein
MSMRKKIATATLMLGGRMTTKEIVPRKIITEDKGTEGPTLTEVDKRMQEI